jgi:hypothetical protein
MIKAVQDWFSRMWQPVVPETTRAYDVTFQSYHGQLVLQHLMDNVYCTVYSGTDPNAALVHNARRTVVHEILENIDMARNPQKYQFKYEEDTNGLHSRTAS